MLSSIILFLNIGAGEMVMIVFAALMLFGGEKLPEIARGLGKGIRDFKDASDDVKREINNQINNYEPKKKEQQKLIEETSSADENQPESEPEYPEPVVGAIPAYESHTATDAIEETETHNPEAPETYQGSNEELPVVAEHTESTIDLTKPSDEPKADTVEEQYK